MPFRLPELLSVVEMSNIRMECRTQYTDTHPYMVVMLEGEREVHLILERCVLVVHIIELWISAESRDQLRSKVSDCSNPEYEDCTFNILLHSFGRKVSLQQKIDLIESMPNLPLSGKVCCKNPDQIFYICENYPGHVPPKDPTHVYFGRWIGSGQRSVIDGYSVKKRSYIGRTSMDAQLSFIMANQAQITKSSLVYDPFLGTGSLLIPLAHFGAVTFGSDIDIKALRGWGKSTRKGEKHYQSNQSVAGNMVEYGLDQGYLGSFAADFQSPLFRCSPLFDAIVTDPPYGIREAALKITKDNENSGLVDYSLSDQYLDLVTFAAQHLVVGGVLVYWLPVVPDKYTTDSVPLHPALQLTANSEQGLSKKAARRLITMRKVREVQAEDSSYIPGDRECHDTFRSDYFAPGS